MNLGNYISAAVMAAVAMLLILFATAGAEARMQRTVPLIPEDVLRL